jgi:hypothetical protein
MFHNLGKVTLVMSRCTAATETTILYMMLSETSGIEFFVDNIVIIYIKREHARNL